MGSKKGGKYEREICTELSEWWTDGQRDDVFWRSSGSGARATQRSKKKKKTKGQHGDIAATDPVGAPLLDLMSIEIKRGYSKFTIMDLIDKPLGAAEQEWESWIRQAKRACKHSGSFGWMLICKRDRRDALAVMPMYLLEQLFLPPACMIQLPNYNLGIIKLVTFFRCVSSKQILELIERV